MTFPEKIKIPSDDTELILISVYTTPKTGEQTATYQYTKSKYHKGILTWNEKDFEKNVRKGIIVPYSSRQ